MNPKPLDEADINRDLFASFKTIHGYADKIEGPRGQVLRDLAARAEDRIQNPVHGAGMSPADYAGYLIGAIDETDAGDMNYALQMERERLANLLDQIS